ncbi:DNA-binding anti-repressor SinI [Bacillus sporothermodurans]|nr:DNA-binding anti-repressor SinI [Heyndrickxia sporothermodurans]MBL5772405.1 DNA-binding anti-repressor SinI [Heyndrickxia sporothermodurans]MBL5776094.1 DNA-binding anti-repressor SinI [Heyndrickxia sporothermodurans]MBL5779151.1 DNA-binding anti-repressor SinI [Heyndrickxia sporothermodurans]MBL5781224.1 DNA-binding anti-repressor SinI [Heyndrickxia sporothermodurans]
MELKEKNESIDQREEWRKLLEEARNLGITPNEIRHFLEITKTTNQAFLRDLHKSG